jgi:hypothetical protein
MCRRHNFWVGFCKTCTSQQGKVSGDLHGLQLLSVRVTWRILQQVQWEGKKRNKKQGKIRNFTLQKQYIKFYEFLFVFGATALNRSGSHLRGFFVAQNDPTTVGRTPLDEWSARRRDLYLTTYNTQNTPLGFEPMISAGERPQTYILVRAATGTGKFC